MSLSKQERQVHLRPPLLWTRNCSIRCVFPHPLHTLLPDDDGTGDLLPEHDLRPTGPDKAERLRPEVSFICCALLLSSLAVWLARAATGPDRKVFRPSGKSKSERPTADAGEEVDLSIAAEIISSDIDDASFVDISGRDLPGGDELPEPFGREGVELVVVVAGIHAPSPSFT